MNNANLAVAAGLTLVALILDRTFFLSNSNVTLHMLRDTSGLGKPLLMLTLNTIIRNIWAICNVGQALFNTSGISYSTLMAAHGHLTSYINNYNSLYLLLDGIISFFTGSPDLVALQGLSNNYWLTGLRVLRLYRQIEATTNVPNPIFPQVWGEWNLF